MGRIAWLLTETTGILQFLSSPIIKKSIARAKPSSSLVKKSSPRSPTPTPVTTAKYPGEFHYPGYQYLGPGTQYEKRQALGIEPINDLDRIAMAHDRRYGSRVGSARMMQTRALARSFYDMSAGIEMVSAATNPWSDAPLVESFLAGHYLMAQGILRLHPSTYFGVALADAILL